MAFVIDDLLVAALSVSTLGQVGASVAARNKQKDAEEARSRIEARQQQRQQLQQIREQQRQVAARQAAAATTGTLDSSGLEGAVSGIRASTAGNIAFQNQMFEGGQRIKESLGEAQDIQFWKGIGQSLQSSLTMGISSGVFGSSGPTGQQPVQANQALSQGSQTSSVYANQLSRGAGVA